MKHHVCLLLLLNVSLAATTYAQTHLATRGTDQLLVGNTLFTMQDQVDYRVVGVSRSGGVYIETPVGAAEFPKAKRFRVLQGGTFAEDLVVELRHVTAKFLNQSGVSPNDPKHGLRQEGGATVFYPTAFCGARYSATLISPVSMGHVYVAFQWYIEGQPVATGIQEIGTVTAHTLVSVGLDLPLALSQASGTYTVNVYSGYLDVKHSDTKEVEPGDDVAKQNSASW